MNYIYFIFSSIGLLTLVSIFLVWNHFKPSGVPLEIIKALLNITTAVLISQGVAFIVNKYNEDRKKESFEDETRNDLLNCLNNSFIDIKKIRRKARAISIHKKSAQNIDNLILPFESYISMMEIINDVQLNLEIITKNIETKSYMFKNGKNIFNKITIMEEYLNSIVDEWEHVSIKTNKITKSINTCQLPKLNDMIGTYRTSEFRTKFVHPYYESVESIRASLTNGKAKRWKLVTRPLTQ